MNTDLRDHSQPCEHGLLSSHDWTTTKPLEAGDLGLSGGWFPDECPGGRSGEPFELARDAFRRNDLATVVDLLIQSAARERARKAAG